MEGFDLKSVAQCRVTQVVLCLGSQSYPGPYPVCSRVDCFSMLVLWRGGRYLAVPIKVGLFIMPGKIVHRLTVRLVLSIRLLQGCAGSRDKESC